RTAHRLLAPLPAAVARRWRADCQVHGLLRSNGREAFTGCILLPLIPVRDASLAPAALARAALADPRAYAVRSTGPGWIVRTRGEGCTVGLAYAGSVTLDALTLQAAGVAALAVVDGEAPWAAWRGLHAVRLRVQPRRL